MTRDDDSDSIVGLPVADAANEVVGRREAEDADEVRATLDRVASDGIVTRDAVEEALTEASMVVSTAETRTELASHALADAREAAAPVSDLDAVAARLDAFESRLAAVEGRSSALGSDLESLVERTGESGRVYDVAARTGRLRETAERVQRDADELQLDLESFEQWLATPETRFRELGEDADAVERALADLARAVGEIPPATEGDADSSGVDWATVRLRHRVLELLLADVRFELADLRAWADREEDHDAPADDLADRLDHLDVRLADLGDRLDDIARPSWTDRFGDRVASFETATASMEPPLDWAELEAAFDEHRPVP